MKVYARQIPPEYQESPLMRWGMDDTWIQAAISGNGCFTEFTCEEYDTVIEALDKGELSAAIQDKKLMVDYYGYETITEFITEILPPKHKNRYSTKEIHRLKDLIIAYDFGYKCNYQQIICDVLSVMTGHLWDHQSLRGACQSDWNHCYYDTAFWSYEDIERLESEYFNMGSEWIIDTEDFHPDIMDPAEIQGYSMYCYEWNIEGIKKEIANCEGASPEDVILYSFDGYSRNEIYKRV